VDRLGRDHPETGDRARRWAGNGMENRMVKHRESTRKAGATADRDDVEHRIQRLERRLARANETEAKRARKLERAQDRGASHAVVAARRRKLLKAHRRGQALERKLAEIQSPSVAAVVSEPSEPRAYCLRERKTIVMRDPRETVMRNGRPALAGICPSCGAKVVRAVRSRPG